MSTATREKVVVAKIRGHEALDAKGKVVGRVTEDGDLFINGVFVRRLKKKPKHTTPNTTSTKAAPKSAPARRKGTSTPTWILLAGAALLVVLALVGAVVASGIYFASNKNSDATVVPSAQSGTPATKNPGKVSNSGFTMELVTTNHGKDLEAPASSPQNIWTIDAVITGKFEQSGELRLVLMHTKDEPKVLTHIAQEQVFGGKADCAGLTIRIPPNSKGGYHLVLVDRAEKVLCREPVKLQ